MPCEQISIATCQQYLKKHHGSVSGEWFNKKIAFLNKLFKYVVAEGPIKASDNPAIGLLRDKVQDKKRQRLSVAGFEQIRNHPDSPKWFQIAMDLALQLGHGRNEILTLKFRIGKPSYSENDCVWFAESTNAGVHGTIYINRKKTQKHESAHVAISISNKLKEIIAQSQDHLKCPFIVHRKPQRKPKKMAACLDHSYQVSPELFNKQFRTIDRSLPMYQHLDKE